MAPARRRPSGGKRSAPAGPVLTAIGALRNAAAAARKESPERPVVLRQQAVRLLNAAQELETLARRQLALLTTPRDPAVPSTGQWERVERAARRHERRLLGVAGVWAVGVGFRRRAGQKVDEPAVVVFVRKKRPLAALHRSRVRQLPTALKLAGGPPVPVDVVELPERTGLAGRIGESLGPAGTGRFATLGTFALDEQQRAVALTAMHLFKGMPRPIGARVTCPARFVNPGAPVVGRVVDGTLDWVDAAKIQLDNPVVPSWEVAGHRIRGWRSAVPPSDHKRPVWMAGAASGLQGGQIDYILNNYPPLGLGRSLLVSIGSEPGDSGSALLDSDTFVLGLLVGQVNRNDPASPRLFTDIGAVLVRLTCDIPTR